MADQSTKPVRWIGSSRKDLGEFPTTVKRAVGHALWIAQNGGKHADARPLKGFQGADVVEIVEDHDGDTFRAIYTVRIQHAVYVLHAFQKKSKRGIKTPKPQLELIRRRLRVAEADAAARNQAESS